MGPGLTRKELLEAEAYIDTYWKQSPLMELAPAQRLLTLLYGYDLYYFVEQYSRIELAQDLTPGFFESMRMFREGYVQACRWIGGGEDETPSLGVISASRAEQAYHFIQAGAVYARIADFCRMYWRRQLRAIGWPDMRCVRFEYEEGHAKPSRNLVEVVAQEWATFRSAEVEHGRLKDRVFAHFAKVDHLLVGGCISLPAPEQLDMQLVGGFYRTLYDFDAYFTPTDKIGPCTLEEFIRLATCLKAWSECCLVKYTVLAQSGTPQDDCMPTQLVHRKQLVRRLSKMSGLNSTLVEDLIDVLTFDTTSKNPDGIITPLFKLGTHIGWSAHALNSSRQPRNYLKALSRHPSYKADADNAIGEREKVFAEAVAAEFRKHGWVVDPFIPYRGGEIDLALWHPSNPSELLLAECKLVLHIDELNEVFAASDYLATGQQQIREAIEWLRTDSRQDARGRFKSIPVNQITDYVGFVLSPETEMASFMPQADVPVISWQTFTNRLSLSVLSSPREVHRILISRPWEADRKETERIYGEYFLGDQRFQLPGWTSPDDLREMKESGEIQKGVMKPFGYRWP